MDMSSYLRQHADAATVVSEIEKLLAGTEVKDSKEVRSLLNRLIGKLNIHLSVEDKNVYPRAKSSDNAELKALAIKLENEMKDLGGALKSYSDKWNTASKIEEGQADFIKESQAVFTALKNRIEQEESRFYPLLAEHA